MRFYKTWAHELFPKASFQEFTHRTHKLCRERRLRVALEGFYQQYVYLLLRIFWLLMTPFLPIYLPTQPPPAMDRQKYGATGTNLSGETIGQAQVRPRDGPTPFGDGEEDDDMAGIQILDNVIIALSLLTHG